MMIKKSVLYLFILFIQCVLADIFSQLQFIKIISPVSGQSIQLGDKVKIKYVMQPLVFKSTSNGYAKTLQVNFHKRSGNKKQQKLLVVDDSCPVSANKNSYKTHEKEWTIPTDLTPGSYAFDFVELVQLRHREIMASETVKVNIID